MTVQAEYWNSNSPDIKLRNPPAPVDAEEEILAFHDSTISEYSTLRLVVFENGIENTNMFVGDEDAVVIQIEIAEDDGRKHNVIIYVDVRVCSR